ncbi:hypothetical protein [Actinomadura sediminis]|uniref:Uncharacterized protein n=1 Tax=Actinomadura sediminis TaxID=1038904 RepID=A0ABW3EG93_9ACTN
MGEPGASEDLELLEEQVRALRELAGDRPDGARIYDFGVRWGTFLAGRLERLEHYHRSGGLSVDERERYAGLRSRLSEVLPLIEELGLARPRVVPPDD